MRAVTLESVPAAPAVTEIDTPSPEAGEVLVKVAASSVNGFDLSVAARYLQSMMEHRFPLVVGKDFAGTVEAVGEGVDGFEIGQPVYGVLMKPFLGPGAMAAYLTVPAAYGIAALPDGLDLQEAGALGLAGTAALNSLDAAAPAEGETVLISGATGGVGALAVQLAAARGVRVIATARPGAEADFVTGLTVRRSSWSTTAATSRRRCARSLRRGSTRCSTWQGTAPSWRRCCGRAGGSPPPSA